MQGSISSSFLWRSTVLCVLVTGSSLEYGNLTGCVNEDRIPARQGVFAAFKTSERLVGESLFSLNGSTLLWARPFSLYGPGQRPDALVPSAFRSLRKGKKPDIQTPDALKDFTHVDDVARGLAALTTSAAPAGVYNLGSGRLTRIRDLVNLIARLLGRPEVFTLVDQVDAEVNAPTNQAGEGFWANIERIRQHTGWVPLLSLEEGIRKTLASWIEES